MGLALGKLTVSKDYSGDTGDFPNSSIKSYAPGLVELGQLGHIIAN
jgi:hypothetical protein